MDQYVHDQSVSWQGPSSNTALTPSSAAVCVRGFIVLVFFGANAGNPHSVQRPNRRAPRRLANAFPASSLSIRRNICKNHPVTIWRLQRIKYTTAGEKSPVLYRTFLKWKDFDKYGVNSTMRSGAGEGSLFIFPTV